MNYLVHQSACSIKNNCANGRNMIIFLKIAMCSYSFHFAKAMGSTVGKIGDYVSKQLVPTLEPQIKVTLLLTLPSTYTYTKIEIPEEDSETLT